jgi:hypothetical protein
MEKIRTQSELNFNTIKEYLISRGFVEIETDYDDKDLLRLSVDNDTISAHRHENWFTITVHWGSVYGSGTIYLQRFTNELTIDNVISTYNKLRTEKIIP